MMVATKAEALIAVDILAIWGFEAKIQDFINRPVEDGLDGFKLSYNDRVRVEKAISDNLEAFRKWSNVSVDEHNSATKWSLYRPTHLNPLRYKIVHSIA